MNASAPQTDEVVREFPIINQRGLHARASAKFVQVASGFDATIHVEKDGVKKERLFNPYTGEELGDSVTQGEYFVLWLARLHDELLFDREGRYWNGILSAVSTVLFVTGIVVWWPGVSRWKRSLVMKRGVGWKRFNWDLHSALGFWCFPFVLMWAVSGAYLVFQNELYAWGVFDPWGRVAFWLAQLHLGQFNEVVQAAWVPLGLTPAILAFTGMFICCRRIIFKKPSNPKHAPN